MIAVKKPLREVIAEHYAAIYNSVVKNYIAIEGIDGSGKDTVLDAIKEWHAKEGLTKQFDVDDVYFSNEPFTLGLDTMSGLTETTIRGALKLPSGVGGYKYDDFVSENLDVEHLSHERISLELLLISNRIMHSNYIHNINNQAKSDLQRQRKVWFIGGRSFWSGMVYSASPEVTADFAAFYAIPKSIIYVNTPPDVAIERIKERMHAGKDFEAYETKEKMVSVHEKFNDLFISDKGKFIEEMGVNVYVVDGTANKRHMCLEALDFVEDIIAHSRKEN